VQRAALAVAKYFSELDDAALAGGQNLLASEFRRGAQVSCDGVPSGAMSVAKACK